MVISTIHRAKGLEWKAVFIPSLNEEFFPDSRSTVKLEYLEEERRVFYVSITRAKDILTITGIENDSNTLSRFIDIDEISEELYKLHQEDG